MVYRRQVFQSFIHIFNNAPPVVQELGPEFARWAMNNPAHAQASAIRRLNDNRRDSQSMRRLLMMMETIPGFQDDARRDMDRIEEAVEAVEDWVNTEVAHLADPDRIDPLQKQRLASSSVTFKTLHECVDLYSTLLRHYTMRSRDVTPMVEEIIMPPWERVPVRMDCGRGRHLGVITYVGTFAVWPATALATKRLHDIGRSGGYFLLTLIPLQPNPLAGVLSYSELTKPKRVRAATRIPLQPRRSFELKREDAAQRRRPRC